MQHPPTSEHLVVLARPPALGRVKSRLAAGVGPVAALRLYRAFLADTIALVRCGGGRGRDGAPRAIEVCFEYPWTPDGELNVALRGIATTTQGQGDLGRRLARAFVRSRAAGHRACVVIGADSPTLPAGTIDDAFAQVADAHDVALAPATDGGYVLLGLAGSADIDLERFFGDMPWGTADVTARTLERASAAGHAVALLDPWYDVDDAASLARLRVDLADESIAARAPATRAALDDPGTSVL